MPWREHSRRSGRRRRKRNWAGMRRGVYKGLWQSWMQILCTLVDLFWRPNLAFSLIWLSGRSFVFREPVDPVALGIPTYFEVIPRRDARDLRTIRQKLDADKYDTVEAFEADLDLMVDNAIHFNGADSEVGKVSFMVRDKYKDMLSSLRSSSNSKRKGNERGTPQPSKKLKMMGWRCRRWSGIVDWSWNARCAFSMLCILALRRILCILPYSTSVAV